MITMIGLIGEPSTGKDTIADFAIEDHDFRRIGFADKIYSCALAIDPIVATNRFSDTALAYKRVSDIVTEIGWRQAKDDIPEVRRLLQRIGTEMGRETIDDNIWISLAFKRLVAYHQGSGGELERFIFTDVRFPNEADAMTAFAEQVGGQAHFVRVARPGYGVVNNHASESAYEAIPYGFKIINDGTLDDLRADVETVIDSVLL